MPFPQNFLDELLAQRHCGYRRQLRRPDAQGRQLPNYCPFPQRKDSLSFHVLPDKQFYTASAAKKGGGVVNFVMEMEGLTYPDAIRFLAKRANLPVPEESSDGTEKLRSRMLALNRDAARYYYEVCSVSEGRRCRRIWTSAASAGALPCGSAWGRPRTAGMPC